MSVNSINSIMAGSVSIDWIFWLQITLFCLFYNMVIVYYMSDIVNFIVY